jgi:hypothetical protein
MTEEVLRKVLGKRLIGVVGDFHVFEGEVKTTPNSVWLRFDGLPQYRFAGASDGWHLIVDETAPREFNMQESGQVRVVDMAGADSFGPVFQRVLRRAWIICSPGQRDISGVRLDFETATVRIINWGDEMHIAEGLPTDVDRHPVAEYPVQ